MLTSSKQAKDKTMAVFYEQLYNSSAPLDSDIETFLSQTNLYRSLTSEHKRFLDSLITQK